MGKDIGKSILCINIIDAQERSKLLPTSLLPKPDHFTYMWKESNT